MIEAVLLEYGINIKECKVVSYGSGLINNTWIIKKEKDEYILQRINHKVFNKPEYIAENIHAISEYFKINFPAYLFVSPVKTKKMQEMVFLFEEGYFRLFPFVYNSHTIDVVTNTKQAYEAANQFGTFTRQLSGFNTAGLKITLPDFHNLTLRYQQFKTAILNGNTQRIQASSVIIENIEKHKNIVDEFEKIKLDPDFKLRVTHHDTKISNVLFDKDDNGLCVIDLDTIMPGYFISDLGDMMRTYLSPSNEEEEDFTKIKIRPEYLEAVINGYLFEMNNELSEKEKQYFIYSGKFMIYMQAIRFFTDFLNDDIYYGSKYEDHNLNRAKNQLILLGKLIEIEKNN